MYRIHPGYLAWVLEALVARTIVNRITVEDDVAADARTRPRADAGGPAVTTRPSLAIVGSGVAGLYAAVAAAERGHAVVLLTKDRLQDSNSCYAQGGAGRRRPGGHRGRRLCGSSTSPTPCAPGPG